MRALLYFAPLFRRLSGPLLLSLALSLVTLAAGVGLLGVSGWFLTAAALSTAGAAFNLFGPSAGVRGLSFVRILSRYGEKLTGHDATLKLLSDLRAWLFGRLFRLVPLGRRFGRADLVSRLVTDLDALDTVFLVALGPISTAIVAGLVMTALLVFVLPGAAPLYALGFLAAVLGVPAALVLLSRRAATSAIVASGALRQAMLAGIDGHQDLVLFGAIDDALAHAASAAAALGLARRRLGLLGALASATVQLLAGGVLVATLLFGLIALRTGTIEGPTLVGLLLAVLASFEASAMLVRSATRLAGSVAAAERLMAIAEAPADACEQPEPIDLPAGGEVQFEHLSFGYGGRHTVLSDLSFVIHTGDCVAICGPSGAGKSTIAQLMVRLINPQLGRVFVNGCDVTTVSPANLRRRVALMTQDAPVFNDSVRNNLLIGRPDADDASLWNVLESVELAEAIRDLPRGLDAVMGEGGKTLSAGQSRRICLARALLSFASIIILDEPTSGLDPVAEAAFLTELPHLAQGRTVIVITHANVPDTFDRVMYLRAGKVVAA